MKYNNTVTAVISTKNRYHTTLPLVVLSVINQSHKIDKLIIFDDGDHIDLREDPLWKNIFTSIAAKGIVWEMVFSPGKGQVLNHQRSIEMCKTEWIWRLDDDNYAEYDVLEKLLSVADDKTGAVGGLVLDPKMNPHCDFASNRIEDIYLGLNEQWFKPKDHKFVYAKEGEAPIGYDGYEGPREVDHLYSTFIYRKSASKHGYCMDLSVVGHREETIFTYEMKRAGWDILFKADAVTWHYRNSEGGIRTFKDPGLWAWDDSVLAFKMKQWGIETRHPKLIVLDSGLGDHLAFLKVLPEIKAKHKDIIMAVCYPEVFRDHMDVQIISVDAAKMMGPTEEYNVYKFLWDHDKEPMHIIDAYRRLYK